MAIVATQLFDEESLETNEQMRSNIGGAENKLVRASKTYQVTGTSLESEAIAQVRATAPSVYLGLQRRTISIKRRDASDVYVVDVQYRIRTIAGSTDTVEPDPKFSFSTRGETQHIIRSITTVSSHGTTPPNFRGIIGWDGMEAQGVDIYTPRTTFSITDYFQDRKITTDYKRTLAFMCNKVNSKEFYGYQAGEVLFMGVDGARDGDTSDSFWQLTFHFAVEENKTDLKIGSITVPIKKGWDYLWVRYANVTSGTVIVPTPQWAYVEQVYYYDDFKKLGLKI